MKYTQKAPRLPFEIQSMAGLSPSSRTASFYKLENKVLVTQIDENGDMDDDNSLSMHISTYGQSLKTII